MNREPDAPSAAMPDAYDRLLGSLHGLPDVTNTKPSTIRTITPLLGTSELFSVQTYRQRDRGDTIFLECVSKDGFIRLAIPPAVAEAIARQRDALTGKVRSKAAKATAAARKAAGHEPGFMKNKRRPAR
jgi:hypothetical protein